MEPHTEATPPTSGHGVASEYAPVKHPGVWSGLGVVALYFLMQFGFSILVGAAIGLVLAVKAGFVAGMHHHQVDTQGIMQAMRASPAIHVVITVITIAVAAAVMAVIVRRIWPGQWSRADLPGFGFTQPSSKLAYPAAVLLGFSVLVVGGAITQLLAHGHPIHQDVAVMASKAPTGMRALMALLVVGVAPFVEELVFRGVLLSGLASRMRVSWAVLVSALLFGLAHLPDFKFAWYPVPDLVLLGLVLAWLRLRTRSLWPSITLHATNNLLAIMVVFFAAGH